MVSPWFYAKLYITVSAHAFKCIHVYQFVHCCRQQRISWKLCLDTALIWSISNASYKEGAGFSCSKLVTLLLKRS